MMLKQSFHDSFSNPACVTFRTWDGRSIQVNKYFLLLFNDFYRSILDECMDEDKVFIFDGATLDDLTLLKKQIYQKHLHCGDHSQLSEEYQKKESTGTEDAKDLNSRESDEDGKLKDKKSDVLDQIDSVNDTESDKDGKLQDKDKEDKIRCPTKDKSSVDSMTLKCPFKCNEVPDNNC